MKKILKSLAIITLIITTNVNAFENTYNIEITDSEAYFYGVTKENNNANLTYPKLIDKGRYALNNAFNPTKKQFVHTYMYDYRNLSKFNKTEEQLLKEEVIFLKNRFCSINNPDIYSSKIKNIYIFKDKEPLIKEYEFFKEKDCL